MAEEELFALAVAIAVVLILGRVVANRLHLPEAIVLVVLGVLASLFPRVSRIQLAPDVVLLLFLPPLIYHAAFLTAPREARENAIPIAALALGATTATIVVVAAVTRLLLPDLGLAPAVAFAAAIAPTDAVSATSVLTRVGAPQRIVTILEGESLINDGVSLTVFGLALEAVVQPVTFTDGLLRVVVVVFGGIACGLVVALVIGWVRRYIRDPAIQILVSLITPYIAYIPASELGLSGVLATVVTGAYLGTRPEGLVQAASRESGTMFWRTLIFLLESTLFVLLGLDLRPIVEHLSGIHTWPWLLGAAAAVVAATILTRLIWELGASPLSRFVSLPQWRERLVIGWSGMRGAISLAIVLSLPTTLNGRTFDERSTVIFLAAAVVVATLLGQGLTLGPLLRRLGLAQTAERRRAEAIAQMQVTEAGLARLDEMAEAGEVDDSTANLYRQLLELRLDRVRVALGDAHEDAVADTRAVRRELVRAEQEKLAELYQSGRISDQIRRSIAGTLDLQEERPLQ